MRTQDEIVARLNGDMGGDWLGTQTEELVHVLDFTHAKQWLKPGVTEEEWGPVPSEDDVRKSATDYLDFAWGKAWNHRGISAGRSIDHYRSWLWLLFDDDTFNQWASLNYAMYGAPMLAGAAKLLGQDLPTDAELVRMMNGQPCTEDCEAGCR